jgi:hypothetical protein
MAKNKNCQRLLFGFMSALRRRRRPGYRDGVRRTAAMAMVSDVKSERQSATSPFQGHTPISLPRRLDLLAPL